MSAGRGEVDRAGRLQSPRLKINELTTRLENVIQYGTVAEVDYSRGLARVRISAYVDEGNPGRVTDWIPWATSSADSGKKSGTPLQEGAHVMILAPSGDTRQATILPGVGKDGQKTAYSSGTSYNEEYSDGALVGYDVASSAYTVRIPGSGNANITVGGASVSITDGSIELSAGGSRLVINSAGITLEGSATTIDTGTVEHNGTDIGATHTHTSAPAGTPTSPPL